MSGVEAALLSFTAGALSAYGQYQEGRYQANVAKANARVLEANADKIRLETSINEDIKREENRRLMARNFAASVEQGMTGSQTTVGVLGQQATDLEQNVLNLRYKGLSEAESIDIQAYFKRQESKQRKRQAKLGFYTGLINSGIDAAKTYVAFSGGSSGGGQGNGKEA